jgi:hypothetical protein
LPETSPESGFSKILKIQIYKADILTTGRETPHKIIGGAQKAQV